MSTPTPAERLQELQDAAARSIAAHPDDLWASFQEYALEVSEAPEPERCGALGCGARTDGSCSRGEDCAVGR